MSEPTQTPKAPLAPYFPPGAKIVGTDVEANALLLIYAVSGGGKSHLGRQLIESPEYGKDEVCFLVNEDVTSIYGNGAHVVTIANTDKAPAFEVAKDTIKGMLEAARRGQRLPKVVFVDSISGFAHATQSYYREHPIEQWNEKKQEMARNKFAEFGELGTGMIDFMLLLGQLPTTKVVLCTTYENPTKPGAQPELAVEGQMIPKFLTQLTTCALYLKPHSIVFPRVKVDEAKAKGTLEQPYRIVCPYGPADTNVTAIERHFYSQGGGEVLAKGHHALGVTEPAYLPAVLAKMMGKK